MIGAKEYYEARCRHCHEVRRTTQDGDPDSPLRPATPEDSMLQPEQPGEEKRPRMRLIHTEPRTARL